MKRNKKGPSARPPPLERLGNILKSQSADVRAKSSVTKTALKYAGFLVLLLTAIGTAETSAAGAFVLLIAAALMLPAVQKRLALTPLKNPFLLSLTIIILCLSSCVMNAGDISATKSSGPRSGTP